MDGDRARRRPQDSVGALRPPGEGTDTMTQQKTLKRRVRARMSKTGERYTAARAQVLAKDASPAPSPADASRPSEITAPSAPASPFRSGAGASDAALTRRTGHDWAHWYGVLEAWNGADRPHGEIARYLNEEHGVDGWWSQEVTVRYEMAIGRRVPGQRQDGFEATASKTVGVPIERLYEAVVDEAQREQWLSRPLRLRTATPHKSARFDLGDGGERVVFWFVPKGDRSNLAIAHQKMPDAETAAASKAFWRDRVGALQAYLEGAR